MRRFKPSPAMVVALLALLVALGGSALAASYVITKSSQIKDGVITGSDIKNSSLSSSDIKDSSLTGSDIKNGSLLSSDFKAGQLPVGQQGPQGPQGAQGPQGPAGSVGPSDLYTPHFPLSSFQYDVSQLGTFVDVVSEALPDGSYLAYGNAIVTDNAYAEITLRCTIATQTDDPLVAGDTTELVLENGEKGNIALMGAVTISAPESRLHVWCRVLPPLPVGGYVVFNNVGMGALQVGAIH